MSTVAIGSGGGGISLYDLDNERVIGERLYGHGSGIRDLTYSVDGRYLVSVADDGLIGLWGDNGAAGLIAQPVAPTCRNRVLGRWPAGLVFNSLTGRQEVRDAEALDEPGILIQPPPGTPDRLGYAQFSADGSTVVAATEEPIRRMFAERRGDGPPVLGPRGRRLRTGPVQRVRERRASRVALDNEVTRLRAWDITSGRRINDATIADLSGVADGDMFTGVPLLVPTGSTSTCRPTSGSRASPTTWNRFPM